MTTPSSADTAAETPLRSGKPRVALRMRIVCAVVGLVLLIWAGVGLSLWGHYKDTEASADKTAHNLVRVIEAQVHGQLDAMDVNLLAVSKALPLLRGSRTAHDPEVHALLRQLLHDAHSPVRAMWVTNAQGDMVHDSDSLVSTANYAHRAYFTQHRDNPALGLYVGQPIVNDKGVWFVSVSRRITKPDGSFGGVVVAALEPRFFERLFASLDVGRGGSLLLLSSELKVIARVPQIDALRGQNLGGKTPLPSLLSNASEGVYRAIGAADGIRRIYAYRQVMDYPMVVVAGLSQADVVASWWRIALAVLAAAVVLSALLAALGWRVWHALTTTRQLHAELNSAKDATDKALQELESVMSAIPDLMFEMDLDGRIHGYRGQARDLLFVPESVFMHKLIHEVLPQPVVQSMMDALQDASLHGRCVGYPYSLDLPLGTRWFELSVARLDRGAGRSLRFVVLARDITERVHNRESLLEANTQLIRSNSDLEQFAYAASHDLLEPLRSVAGSVQLLQKRYAGQLDDRANTFIAHAVAGVLRMQALIEDLLAFSRLNSKARASGPVDLGDVLATVLENLQVAIAESGAQITHDVLPAVTGDAGQLSHLLQNLVANALKFRGGKPAVVHVGARRDGPQWVFSVSDQGIGIEPKHFARIFGIFKRLHTREEYAGNGIGLTLCQRIVERHGGRIWVESELGQGTTFYFSLPDKVL